MEALGHLLPPAGLGRQAWVLLDTGFSPRRLQAWALAWSDAPAGLLHVVALLPPAHGLTAQALRDAAPSDASYETQGVLPELARHWHGLTPGHHRITLAGGAIDLTLCVGDRPTMLRELRFAADAIYLDSEGAPWDSHDLSALARCRHRGTLLAGAQADAPHAQKLREMGFSESQGLWTCDPPWKLHDPADRLRPRHRGHCAVVGAGLAGASAAAQLARRGWTVDVFESGPGAASGASGLPVGLLIPHVSSADGARSRLTRAGLRRMRQEVESRLPQGLDWGPTGVMELRPDGKRGLPADWPPEGLETSCPVDLTCTQGGLPPWALGREDANAIWHAQAAWVKPAALVASWLDHPRITLHAGSRVESLQHRDGCWHLQDASGRSLGTADDVVVANAMDAPRLLGTLGIVLGPAHGMRGVLSWGQQSEEAARDWPPYPVNGSGSFIPHVPTPDGLAWFAGSTYENTAEPPAPVQDHLQADQAKLRRLLPAVADSLEAAYGPGGGVAHWESVRCVNRDRMPWVGAPDPIRWPGLWISAAMGSRGLSLALLCAELLAAQMGAEPWPVEASLARALDVHRHLRVG